MKVEAKSLNKLKEVSYQLENKVIDLTQSLTAKIQDNKKLMEEIANLKALLEQQGQAHETLKTRELEFNEKFDSQNAEHQQEVENLNRELETIKSEYASAGAKIEQLYKEQAELKQEVQRNIEELNKAKDDLVKRDTIEVDLKSHIEQLKTELAKLQQQQSEARNGSAVLVNSKTRMSTSVTVVPWPGTHQTPLIIATDQYQSLPFPMMKMQILMISMTNYSNC